MFHMATPKGTTPLLEWIGREKKSLSWLSREVGLTHLGLANIAYGKSLPNLVTAFKIEQATAGAVPVASWLGLPLARRLWNEGFKHKVASK